MNNLIPLGRNGRLTAIDLFCGVGGVTEGFLDSECIEMAVAINHSQDAIEAHKKNNPQVIHLTEDVRNIGKIFPFLPRKVNILWASAECTHFSIAAGGRSRDADSRSLAEDLEEYIKHCDPDYFMIENVKEFRAWGPLIEKRDKAGKIVYRNGDPVMYPDPKKRGRDYNAWVERIKSLGYEYQYRDLNAADYGVPTTRVRYFGIFAKKGLPIAFPEQTHSKDPDLRNLKPWVACRDYLHLEDQGHSIFCRERFGKKPLVDKTLARIGYGFKKYCMEDFIAKAYGSSGKPDQVSSLDEPLHTIPANDIHSKIKIEKGNKYFIAQHLQRAAAADVDEPMRTIVTKDEKHLITNQYLVKKQSGVYNTQGIKEPMGSITCKDYKALVTPQYITKQQYGADQVSALDAPLHTITTHGRKQLITPFITKEYGSAGKPINVSSIDEPLGTITPNPKHKMAFVSSSYTGGGQAASINQPLRTLTVVNKHALVTSDLITKGKYCTPAEDPLSQIHYREAIYQEKIRFFSKYVTQDPELVELLSKFILDIKMRYLTSVELARVTGFKENSYLGRTETIKKHHIGNAVPPRIPKLMAKTIFRVNNLEIAA